MGREMKTVISTEQADRLALLTEEALAKNDRHAELLARELLDVVQVLHGPCHVEVGIALSYLALAIEEKGDHEQALQLRTRAGNIFLSSQRALN